MEQVRWMRLLTPEYPEYEEQIRNAHPIVKQLSSTDVEMLWRKFSNENYCASFLIPSEQTLAEFKEWLNE